ncbi:MAG: BrnT family toxin [Candidatus Firestonebacteria bacterium]
MDNIRIVSDINGFEWDKGNMFKNWQKHKVSDMECEQVFFNQPLIVLDDAKYSTKEKRYYCLGKTNDKRMLFLVFTLRGELIRIISARNMSKKERVSYEKH